MDYRRLSDADLVDFSKNVGTQLGNRAVEGLDNDLQDTLAALFTPINGDYEAAIETGVTQTAVKQSSIAVKQGMREDILTRLATVRNYLVAADGKKESFELCGFTYRRPASTIVAEDPSELAGEGRSNGVNYLTWTGNNKPGSVIYEIWRKYGDDGPPFVLHATTRKRAYQDTPVLPGGVYTYKVRAVAANSISNFSNTALIYGSE